MGLRYIKLNLPPEIIQIPGRGGGGDSEYLTIYGCGHRTRAEWVFSICLSRLLFKMGLFTVYSFVTSQKLVIFED